MSKLQEIQAKVAEIIELKGWHKDWCKGGCYIHLEVSEFIESLRGKGDSPPLDEAADVFFTMMAVMDYYGIDPDQVMNRLDQVCNDLKAGVKGADDPELKPDPKPEPEPAPKKEKRYFVQITWKNGTASTVELMKSSYDWWFKEKDGNTQWRFKDMRVSMGTPTGTVQFDCSEVSLYHFYTL